MAAALALGARGRGRTAPNPNVGCIIVRDGRVVGRGWTQPGGRPHAEAMALEQAGALAEGATLYTTLEPCAHVSARGPACSDLIIATAIGHVVIALVDPDARTCGQGIDRLQSAGITVTHGPGEAAARRGMAGFLTRLALGRPHITLKLASSLDGQIALADGTSQWITGPQARAHGHLERARHDAILVGRGTLMADAPRLDVRLAGLEDRSPRRLLLSATTDAPPGWDVLRKPADIALRTDVNDVLVEGGAQTAAAFLAEDLVDRLLLYRAPILIGAGKAALGDIGLSDLGTAHGRWQHGDTRTLGDDRLEVYERVRE
ncbi:MULTISPECIES: bifunctional diaminohydroxyphosphoribosylaminopyrimidine deaminase/5-amino-6-(5-phosphoribosylamino)uracil reductase RibD [unclassified Sphingomonas]|uniref:bifunctional diaminohydroxyphosphoribosylaminopyrimidine deaminase/5-amino-6-(5-phosphoribosylamino)uracil reductase RibD n=1 Tax=unclassified Sphingomonas TaxID=196159 RepID=UPI000BD0EC61|nr:MAG: riboflavin biosynthesis protein RibD [Sphingomonas sp. 12-62-6]OYX40325.1 MAG: riboflavin biosynthesis protein RibD [Sphingomonas sp. 32-62-10]